MVLMVTVPGGSYVTVRDRPNNVLGGRIGSWGRKVQKLGRRHISTSGLAA